MRLFSSSIETETKDSAVSTEKEQDTSINLFGEPQTKQASGLKDVTSLTGGNIHEDTLLTQIDEFRKKAEALQNLINDRQDKFNELEDTLKQSEGRYAVLQNEMKVNKEILTDVLEDMKAQLNVFADRIDTSVNNTVTEAVKDAVSSVNSTVNDALNTSVSSTVNTAIKEANEPVIDKIHSENVRLYRNLYDFIKEDYDMDEIERIVNSATQKGRGPVRISLFLGILNTLLLVAVLLVQFGIIKF